jgi:hypothetical protein
MENEESGYCEVCNSYVMFISSGSGNKLTCPFCGTIYTREVDEL